MPSPTPPREVKCEACGALKDAHPTIVHYAVWWKTPPTPMTCAGCFPKATR
jgi:hypothetical protein